MKNGPAKSFAFRQAGFSLIEIIIVTVIILLITGGTMVTTGAYKDRQEQVAAMGEVRSFVELARNYAVTMQWPAGTNTDQKYTQVAIAANKITITAIPVDGGLGTAVFTEKDITDSDVTISNIVFCFSAYDAKVTDCAGGVLSPEILIGTNGYKVLINSNGQIGQTSP